MQANQPASCSAIIIHQQTTASNYRVVHYLLTLFLSILVSHSATPQGYFNPMREKKLFLNVGIGFGVANQPLHIQSKAATGITVSGAVGFRFNSRFAFDFGPSFWLESADLFDGSAQNNERPQNRRSLVSLNGYYRPVKHGPFQLRIGAGFGSLVYTPKDQVVRIESGYITRTEITQGFGATAGVLYEWPLSPGIKIHPSIIFSYTNLEPQKIDHETLINHHKPSLTGEFRMNVYLFK